MDAAGQRLVEVRHQRDVVAVVAADVVQSVAEVLAAGEVLLVAGEAAGQRMPAGVDDAGAGQHQVDQADVQEVVRHLVDEKRRPALAVHPGVVQVLPTQGTQAIGVQRREHVVVGGGAEFGALAAQVVGQGDDLRQLHRALDQRMARQDLFDQGRARAREADDEDGIGRIVAPGLAFGEEIGAEQFDRAPHAGAGVVGAIGKAGAAAGIAALIELEGFGMLARVFQGLAQGELELAVLLGIEVAALQLLAHGGDVFRREAEGLQVGKAPPGFAEAWVQFDAAPVGGEHGIGRGRVFGHGRRASMSRRHAPMPALHLPCRGPSAKRWAG